MPSETIFSNDENSKYERRIADTEKNNTVTEYKPKILKICREGYKFDNGGGFVEVICSSNHEWMLRDGSPVPRYSRV